MTTDDFRAWLVHMDRGAFRSEGRLSDPDAADLLGCGIATVYRYRHGQTAVPHYIGLACAALAYEPSSLPPINDFIRWLERMDRGHSRSRGYLSDRDAAALLGCSPVTIINYREGRSEIPHYIALACSALTFGLQPWRRPGADDQVNPAT